MKSFFGEITIFLGLVAVSLACMCQPQHPQDKFCNMNFVFKGKVQRKTTSYMNPMGQPVPAIGPPGPRVPQMIHYQMMVGNIFRNSSTGNFVMRKNQMVNVTTNGQQSMCGKTDLQEGQTYLITAMEGRPGELVIFYCGWNVGFRDLSQSQRKMLKKEYRRVCDQSPRCRVAPPCHGDASRCPRVEGCIIDNEDCRMKHSWCERSPRTGSCEWRSKQNICRRV